MMMKKILTILILAVVLTNCTKLDIAPNSQLTGETSYQSKSEFLNGLAGVYTTVGYWSEVVYKAGGSTDEMIFPARGADWKGDLQSVYAHTWTPTNGEIAGLYSGMSKMIAVSNTFIDAIDASNFKDDKDIKVIRGEARFVRAFGYYLMLDYFGKAPLVTTSAYDPQNLPKQNSRQELYTFVESELKDLSTNVLPASNSYGRADKYAAETLLAKLYLNAQVYLGSGTTKWPDVVTLTGDIMNNSSYILEDNFKDVFKWDNYNSKEIIFPMVCDSKNTAASNISYLFSITDLSAKYGSYANGWDGCATLPTFYRSFEATDVRRDQWIAGPQFAADGTTPIIATDDQGVDRQLDYTIDFIASDPVNNADHWDGVRGGKYLMDGIGGTMVSSSLNNDMPIFRFADVLMMRAEALYRQNPGSTEALQLVNQVRTRNGHNPVADLTVLDDATLLAERGREFAWEGWRRNDLIRFGKYDDAWDYKAASAAFHDLFPIPQVQRESNPNLGQNDGY